MVGLDLADGGQHRPRHPVAAAGLPVQHEVAAGNVRGRGRAALAAPAGPACGLGRPAPAPARASRGPRRPRRRSRPGPAGRPAQPCGGSRATRPAGTAGPAASRPGTRRPSSGRPQVGRHRGSRGESRSTGPGRRGRGPRPCGPGRPPSPHADATARRSGTRAGRPGSWPRTRGRRACWPAVVRGMVTPAARHSADVNPEQRKATGPSAPHRYGLPSWRRAKATAAPARGEGRSGAARRGARRGRSGRASRGAGPAG